MRKYILLLTSCLALFLFVTACNPICEDCKKTIGYAYFPLEVGRFIEYSVAEEEFALGRGAVSRSYQWKESITEKYQDAANQTVFKIIRYKRTDDSQKWQPDSVFTVRQSLDQIVKNESGKEYVKLVFPIAEKLSWNGNIFNNLGEDKYELRNIEKSYKINGQTFDKSISVIQQNDSTLVGQDKRTEIYAENIGLIYKENISLQFCSSSPSCVGKAQIDFGRRRYVRFRRNGVE